MKIYKNQTKNSAKDLGFLANWEFVNDKNISPYGVDITKYVNLDKIEVSILEEKTNTITIRVMNQKEFNNWKIAENLMRT